MSRRAALRGITAAGASFAIPLPSLEIMFNGRGLEFDGRAFAAIQPRFVHWFSPIGYPHPRNDNAFNPLLDVFGQLRSKMTLINRIKVPLNYGNTAPLQNGHAIGFFGMLTGVAPIPNGAGAISIDQFLASKLGPESPLNLAIPQQLGAGDDIGLQKTALHSMSWKGAGQPATAYRDPSVLFAEVISLAQPSSGTPTRPTQLSARDRYRNSVLDYVKDRIIKLQNQLGSADKKRLEEHLAATRSLEIAVNNVVSQTNDLQCPSKPSVALRGVAQSGNYESYADAMIDLLAYALKCNLRRVTTFMYGNASFYYAHNGVLINQSMDLHNISHNNTVGQWEAYTRHHFTMAGRFLQKLNDHQEGNGISLLDNCRVLMSTELGDAESHQFNDYRFLLAGGPSNRPAQGGTIDARQTDIRALHVSILRMFGVQDSFAGHSTPLSGL